MKYVKIFNIGDPMLINLLNGEVETTEKVDGSQFRVMFDNDSNMLCGSKDIDYQYDKDKGWHWIDKDGLFREVDTLFKSAVQKAEELVKPHNFKNTFIVFEYLAKPKHNTLNYSRIPKNNLVLLNIKIGEKWLSYEEMKELGDKMGFETTPMLYRGEIKTIDEVKKLLERDSFLGNTKIEGIVIKNYNQLHSFGHLFNQPVFGKYVRKEFRELNNETWNVGKSTENRIMEHFPQEPRLQKALQHLKEKGELEGTPKDIGKILKEMSDDFEIESEQYVKDFYWNEIKKRLKKRMVGGMAERYKEILLENQFKIGE